MIDGDGGAGQLAARLAAAQVLVGDQVRLERLGPARLEFLQAEVVALHQERPAVAVDQAVLDLGAVGVALEEGGGDAAVLRDVGDAFEGGEPPVDPAAEDEQERDVHHPDAEARIAAALGEDEPDCWMLRACGRFAPGDARRTRAPPDLDAVAAALEILRNLFGGEGAGSGPDAEAKAQHAIEAPLRIADQVVDARQPLQRAGDEIESEAQEQRSEPPGMEEVVQLEPAVRAQHPGPAGEGPLDVRERVVLRVDESAGDHPAEEKEQIRGRRELCDVADGGSGRAGREQLFGRDAHRETPPLCPWRDVLRSGACGASSGGRSASPRTPHAASP